MLHTHELTDKVLISQAHSLRREALNGSESARRLAREHEVELRSRFQPQVGHFPKIPPGTQSAFENEGKALAWATSSEPPSDFPLQYEVTTWDASTDNTAQSICRLLRNARELLEMDIAFVSEFLHGRRIFRYIDADASQPAKLHTGQSDPLEETYCQRVVDGRLPLAIPDTQTAIEIRDLPVTKVLDIRAYLSAPIVLLNGELYGTLCCISHRPRTALGNRQIDALRSVATLVSIELQKRQIKSNTI